MCFTGVVIHSLLFSTGLSLSVLALYKIILLQVFPRVSSVVKPANTYTFLFTNLTEALNQ
jgi:hypothetical protein